MFIILAACMSQAGCLAGAEHDPALGQATQATTCGTTDESQHVNLYDGSFEAFSQAFVRNHKGPVGAMELRADSSADVKFCSGTLISGNRFLTAGHCVDSSTAGQFVAFNFEFTLTPIIGIAPQTHVRISRVLEVDHDVDFAILQLAGNPNATFGATAVALANAGIGEPIAMIGHPDGNLKKVEAGTVAPDSDGTAIRYFNLDTLGGSSGSGILDASGRIVGVHTLGGCTSTGGSNSGVPIARIRAASNEL